MNTMSTIFKRENVLSSKYIPDLTVKKKNLLCYLLTKYLFASCVEDLE